MNVLKAVTVAIAMPHATIQKVPTTVPVNRDFLATEETAAKVGNYNFLAA